MSTKHAKAAGEFLKTRKWQHGTMKHCGWFVPNEINE